MGFRFSNLSPNYKFYVSRISLNSYTNQSRFVIPILQFATQFQHHYVIFPDNPHYTNTRRWHVGHSHHHLNSSEEADKVFKLGLAADVALAAGKGITGYLSGSTAIIADAAHSVSDIVLSGVALWSFRVARTPKDKEHPYGHGKFETLGALGISCMLLATAGGIAWHGVDILMALFPSSPEIANHSWSHQHVNSHVHGGHHHGIDVDHPFLALSMTIVSISVKEGLFWITKRAGEREGSGLMKANAWHHRADAISSVVALIGVGGSILGIKFLDPLAGLVVSGMILKAGLDNGYQSVMELVDAGVPSALLDPIRQTILGVEGVEGCHHLRGRKAGSSMYLDIHIEVDPFLSVSAAHDIGENVRHQIHKFHNEVAEVFIHIDPAISKYAPSIVDRQDALRGLDHRTTDTCSEKNGVESIVSDIFLSKFPEKMIVEHSTPHLLEGKIFLQVEVSMPPDMLIRDAMEFAKKAEEEIFKAAPCVKQVSILLRLGHPVPQFRH